MYTPKISVTILSYNFERYIGECIESVLAQTLPPFEIIVSDDCSSDKSWAVIEDYQKRYPNLLNCLRQNRNIGQVENARAVLRIATGELISSMDGDDRWLPGKLEKEWAALQQNPQARIAYSNVYVIDDQGRRMGVWYDGVGAPPPSGDIFVELLSGKCFPIHMAAFRQELMYKSVLDDLGFDEQIEIFLDLDIKIRATARFPAVYSAEALVEYRHHSLGIHNSPLEKVFKDKLLVYLKNLHLLASRTAEEGRQIKLSIAKQMFKLVNDIQIVCDDRLQLINRLDDECKKILRAADERLALIHRLDREIKETQKLNLELQNVCDERLRIIEAIEKIADQRLKLIETLEAKCKEYERSVSPFQPSE